MLMFSICFIFISCYVLVHCEIPNLNVRKLDRQLIARKRQDTLEMCRIFTEENAKIAKTKPKIIESYKHIRRNGSRRHKRDIGTTPELLPPGVISQLVPARPSPQQTGTARRTPTRNQKIREAFFKLKNDQQTGSEKYSVNPALSPEDAKKIENIVRVMYDEMEEYGDIAYKKNPNITDDQNFRRSTATTTSSTTEEHRNFIQPNPQRRLYFAPKLLVGPENKLTPSPFNQTTIYDKARWRYGIVPYFIDSKTYDSQLQEVIMSAFDYMEKATCIRMQRLRERPTDRKSLQEVDWVYISNPSGVRQCVHSNEKRKVDGVQMSVLGYDCISIGDIVHEVMHILGFSHEHTRSDRDQYISVHWDNIKPGYKKYFEIAKSADQYTLEHLPYDYASVLHYPPRAFSKNGQITINVEPDIKIGQREGLSEIDLEKIGFVYGGECVERNKEYLLKTCPSVVRSEEAPAEVSQKDIENYFKDRLWPFGIINYKLRDSMEFSIEERENIKAVFNHIEKETCIQFNDISTAAEADNDYHEDEEVPDNGVLDDDFDPDDPSKQPPKIVSIAHDADSPEDRQLKNAAENEIIATDNQNKVLTDNGTLNNEILKEGLPTDGTTNKRIRRQVTTPAAQRRHANNVMVLTRTAVPGCKCPNPGKPNGNAVLEINADCFNSVNDLLHMFVHVLGLDHQHNMHDRDHYLHIVWNNLTQDIREELKEKLPPAASAGFPYDYQSVMHYPWLQIKNGISNMMYPIWNDGWAMGHWQGLSSFDVQKLNLLYFTQCSEREKQSQH